MRRLIGEEVCPVVQFFPEAIVNEADYRCVFIAVASGFLMAVTDEYYLFQRFVLYSMYMSLCADCLSFVDSVSERVLLLRRRRKG